jgi:signal transduction histidine kinase
MLNFVLEIVCTFLMAMSLIFIVIELRARFDKSFLIFGITNLLLAFFCAIDLWIQPNAQILSWTRIQHVIAAFFPVFILWYLMILLRKERESLIRIMFFIGACFSILFFTNLMLKPSEKEITSTMVYNFTFAPYMLIAIIFIVLFLAGNLSKSAAKDQKVLWFHLFGIMALAAGGIIDMITVFIGHRVVPEVATFVIPGLLLFGLIVTSVFIDRLTAIIRTREITFGKLQDAYKELEEVQTLKELGQSTAIINHEIKNYAFAISGNAQFLLDRVQLSDKHKEIIETIANTAVKMSDFSKEILNFSMARILSDKRQLGIFSLIENCVQTHFPNKQDVVKIGKGKDDLFIHGDWQKLEHVFVNILKNAFEAEARTVSFNSLRRDTVLLLVIEDDGVGCTEDQMGSLFKSFYTTKKGKGGTGLGMCVIRSIVESHGGYINAYSKNLLNNGMQGLVLNMAFPIYNNDIQDVEDKKDPVVLIKDGIENLANIIRVFQNVMVTPYIVQKADEIDLKEMALEKTAIYASTDSLEKFRNKFGKSGNTHALVHGSKNIMFVVNETKDKNIQAFSERYVLENLH